MAETFDITTSNRYVERELRSRLMFLGEVLDGDVLTAIIPIYSPLDDLIRDAVEGIPKRQKNLFVILETAGGQIEIAERIAELLRHHYRRGEVNFIIPDSAMSAGTVLVMCGDRILMDYYSVLGPIDPQVMSATTGKWVPALGYLDKFQEYVDKSSEGKLSAAELAFMVEKFDPAELDQFEKARDLSVDLLKKWLVRYKFKNWKVTETQGKKVTQAMRSERAAEIAKKLNKTSLWKTHSRGISMEVLVRELKLVIEDFGSTQEKNDAIRSYYRLLQDYMIKRGSDVAIQTAKELTLF
ncbi:MAG: serine dehydrogenasease [Pseudomonadota bacterium]